MGELHARTHRLGYDGRASRQMKSPGEDKEGGAAMNWLKLWLLILFVAVGVQLLSSVTLNPLSDSLQHKGEPPIYAEFVESGGVVQEPVWVTAEWAESLSARPQDGVSIGVLGPGDELVHTSIYAKADWSEQGPLISRDFHFTPHLAGPYRLFALVGEQRVLFARPLMVAAAVAAPLVRKPYLAFTASPAKALPVGSGEEWKTSLRLRLLRDKDSVVRAVFSHDLEIELDVQGGVIDRPTVVIPKGRSAPLKDLEFSTSQRTGNRVRISLLSHDLPHADPLSVPCSDRRLELLAKCSGVEAPATGRDSLKVQLQLVDAESHLPRGCPGEGIEIELSHDLSGARFGESTLVLAAGESLVATTISSYATGKCRLDAAKASFPISGLPIVVRFRFPWLPMFLCIVGAVISALAVYTLHGKKTWTHSAVACVVAITIWLGLQQGAEFSEAFEDIIAPFTPTGALLVGLIAGFAGGAGSKLIAGWFTSGEVGG